MSFLLTTTTVIIASVVQHFSITATAFIVPIPSSAKIVSPFIPSIHHDVSSVSVLEPLVALYMAPPRRNSREDEIRRKISSLKKEGKLKKEAPADLTDGIDDNGGDTDLDKLRLSRQKLKQASATTDYSNAVASKLGGGNKVSSASVRMGRSIRGVDPAAGKGDSSTTSAAENTKNGSGSGTGTGVENLNYADPLYDDYADDDDDEEEEALVEQVAQRLMDKRTQEAAERIEREKLEELERMKKELEDEEKDMLTNKQSDNEVADRGNAEEKQILPNKKLQQPPEKTTSGIGGSWAKDETKQDADYVPTRGSWGAFPRPKNISKAYGGGRQIGAGVAGDKTNDMRSEEDTKQKLKEYRERVGIDVQSEKDNAEEIDEALELAFRAMQRGMYTTAVSSLEKITKFCSSNSKTGSKVFLELAMAYEASGRAEEAIIVYKTLTTSRNEAVKYNARRLLGGIEAMNFMRDEVKAENFSRKKVTSTFIDTTGLANFANNFDDKYETAYVDLDKKGGFYKRLTENVVRSNREARQVLMRARGSGEVDRLRVVQALRSVARKFDEAMTIENTQRAEAKEEEEEPVAIMNGVPIRKSKRKSNERVSMDKFNLASPDDMVANLDGEWRLQLMADKKGDTVNYFNSTLSWQRVDSSERKFKAICPAGFLTCGQEGTFDFDRVNRVISRDVTSSSGAPSFLSTAFLGKGSSRTGAPAAVLAPQQILSIDSSLCISRLYGLKVSSIDNVKDFYCVWRRVEIGTYCKECP